MARRRKKAGDTEDRQEQVQLIKDFPGLRDRKVSAQLFKHICGRTGLEKNHQFKLDKMFTLTLNLDIPTVVENCLPTLYEQYAPEAGAKEQNFQALEKALSKMCQMLIYLKDNMPSVLTQGLEEAMNFAIHKEEDRGLMLTQVRDYLEKKYRVKLKPGRKRTPVHSQEVQKTKDLYAELMKILEPGFDKHKQVTKMRAICEARDTLQIPDPHSQIVDQLWGRRSAKQVAIFLIAKKLVTSESTVKRHLAVP